MVHESWHADFITERWKNGYDPQNDAEPTLKTSKLLKPIYGDYYPDSWESNPFSKLIDDYYGNSGSIGNKYEEMMGNKAEKESFLNGKTEYSKSYDWSFEKIHYYQIIKANNGTNNYLKYEKAICIS